MALCVTTAVLLVSQSPKVSLGFTLRPPIFELQATLPNRQTPKVTFNVTREKLTIYKLLVFLQVSNLSPLRSRT